MDTRRYEERHFLLQLTESKGTLRGSAGQIFDRIRLNGRNNKDVAEMVFTTQLNVPQQRRRVQGSTRRHKRTNTSSKMKYEKHGMQCYSRSQLIILLTWTTCPVALTWLPLKETPPWTTREVVLTGQSYTGLLAWPTWKRRRKNTTQQPHQDLLTRTTRILVANLAATRGYFNMNNARAVVAQRSHKGLSLQSNMSLRT